MAMLIRVGIIADCMPATLTAIQDEIPPLYGYTLSYVVVGIQQVLLGD